MECLPLVWHQLGLPPKCTTQPSYLFIRKSRCTYALQSRCLPSPLMNIINGGAHASNNLDIQEFMIIPSFEKFV